MSEAINLNAVSPNETSRGLEPGEGVLEAQARWPIFMPGGQAVTPIDHDDDPKPANHDNEHKPVSTIYICRIRVIIFFYRRIILIHDILYNHYRLMKINQEHHGVLRLKHR